VAARTTIIIVNWNTCDLLAGCLASVYADRPDAVVVVVDNASADGTVDKLSPRFPQARWIASAENLGFARGNNLVLREVQTEFAWLLNPDTEVRAGAIGRLEAWLDLHPRAAIAGAGLWNPDGTPQACSFAFPTPVQSAVEWLFLPKPVARLRDRVFGLTPRRAAGPTDWVLGAAMLVRMTAVREVGVLDDGYFMYAEELDWCHRFRAAGWEVHLEPAAHVLHHGGAGTSQVREQMLLELFASRARYFRRNQPAWRAAWFGPLVRLGSVWNALYLRLRPQPGWRPGLPAAVARAASEWRP
jgi:GT2 family glycosyltransferase